mgnify:CR=1 FL=1
MNTTPLDILRATLHSYNEFADENDHTAILKEIAQGCPGELAGVTISPVTSQMKFYFSEFFVLNRHPFCIRFTILFYDDGTWDIFRTNLTSTSVPTRMRQSVADKELNRVRNALRTPYREENHPTPRDNP